MSVLARGVGCKLGADLQDKRDLIKVDQLIDLTDKPIDLARDEISCSTVRSVASNCICCCCNNSITLVTTENSYILDHVPLDNISLAQTNPSLRRLAMSNERQVAIINLLESDIRPSANNNNNHDKATKARAQTMIVNLAAEGLSASDLILWRWLDDSTLALLSREHLFTCSLEQQHIGHPAMSALPESRPRLLALERVFELHHRLADGCRVTDIGRDTSGNLFTVSGCYLYSSSSSSSKAATIVSPAADEWLHLKHYRSQAPGSQRSQSSEGQTRGLVQVYCKLRQRSQLIQAHAVTFTNPMSSVDRLRLTRRRFSAQIGLGSSLGGGSSSKQLDHGGSSSSLSGRQQQDTAGQRTPTILVAANKIGRQMRVYFVEMASDRRGPFNGRSASPVTAFNRLPNIDFPTSIVCSHITDSANPMPLHVAMITTKHGQLFVCSVAHSTILFTTTIINDIISSTILDTTTKGLMVICRGGKVLLVKLNLTRLMSLLDENKSLRHISSSHNLLSSMSQARQKLTSCLRRSLSSQQLSPIQSTNSSEIGLDVIMSTKL